MSGQLRGYCAVSLDGFLAGEGDDLGFLDDNDHEVAPDEGVVTYEAFMSQVGAMLMGRRTLDVVLGFDVPWPYGEVPVLVASHRPLPDDAPDTVSRVEGDIAALCTQALERAGGKDVYLDGGGVLTQALEAGLVHELIVTVAPTFLGRGVPLYTGGGALAMDAEFLGKYHRFHQLRLTPRRA